MRHFQAFAAIRRYSASQVHGGAFRSTTDCTSNPVNKGQELPFAVAGQAPQPTSNRRGRHAKLLSCDAKFFEVCCGFVKAAKI